jgi:hypothetical protein
MRSAQDLLNMRKIQETLAKQKEYAEAHKMKLKADSVVPPPRTRAALHTRIRTLMRTPWHVPGRTATRAQSRPCT